MKASRCLSCGSTHLQRPFLRLVDSRHVEAFRAGSYVCPCPPVPTDLWTSIDWCRWIDGHGRWTSPDLHVDASDGSGIRPPTAERWSWDPMTVDPTGDVAVTLKSRDDSLASGTRCIGYSDPISAGVARDLLGFDKPTVATFRTTHDVTASPYFSGSAFFAVVCSVDGRRYVFPLAMVREAFASVIDARVGSYFGSVSVADTLARRFNVGTIDGPSRAYTGALARVLDSFPFGSYSGF